MQIYTHAHTHTLMHKCLVCVCVWFLYARFANFLCCTIKWKCCSTHNNRNNNNSGGSGCDRRFLLLFTPFACRFYLCVTWNLKRILIMFIFFFVVFFFFILFLFLFIHHHLCTRTAPFCIGDLCSVWLSVLLADAVVVVVSSKLSIAKLVFASLVS